ncbi:amidohydrolase family protein [Jiella marina]|uniref:amidohydrolase family protein n=1 Tax=Jiella sp. LLJ827 TaxID=2917712 RepID=UPI00210165F5|nr:amidohydrolase family protein [Jiella sp. LLJ827]MCQ0988494.1 amidohydrolase family protein [Jiella sp. LLJ827]
MDLVDAHHHFWHPARGDYVWMPQDHPVLSRPYAPHDLAPALAATGVKWTVLVQAAPSVAETEYLLGLADASEHVAAVVGWIDFERPADLETLRRFADHPKFVGVRPMIQDIPDDHWMLREDVQWAFQAIVDLDLTFDALGFPRHLANFHTILTRYPGMRAVLDHCLKPDIAHHSTENFAEWADGMARIADETRACCKLSGLVTEAGPHWREADLKPYVDHVLKVFGPKRLMWGSDWPVCRLASEYEAWHTAAVAMTDHLNDDDKAAVFAGTATQFYRLM